MYEAISQLYGQSLSAAVAKHLAFVKEVFLAVFFTPGYQDRATVSCEGLRTKASTLCESGRDQRYPIASGARIQRLFPADRWLQSSRLCVSSSVLPYDGTGHRNVNVEGIGQFSRFWQYTLIAVDANTGVDSKDLAASKCAKMKDLWISFDGFMYCVLEEVWCYIYSSRRRRYSLSVRTTSITWKISKHAPMSGEHWTSTAEK